MTDIVNLKNVRKRKARAEREALADFEPIEIRAQQIRSCATRGRKELGNAAP